MSLSVDPIDSIAKILKGVVFLIVISLFSFLIWDDFRLTKQVQQQKSEIADYKTANEDMAVQVGRCNTAVDQIKQDADRREKAAVAAVTLAQNEAMKLSARADAILKQGPSGSDCEATARLLSEYYRGKP